MRSYTDARIVTAFAAAFFSLSSIGIPRTVAFAYHTVNNFLRYLIRNIDVRTVKHYALWYVNTSGGDWRGNWIPSGIA